MGKDDADGEPGRCLLGGRGPFVVGPHPFVHAVSDTVFTDDELGILDACVAAQQDWDRHESFYRCDMAVITGRVPRALRRDVARVLQDHTGMPLHSDTTVTAQRMVPGDGARVHTDCPRLGFEAVRLVVQLDGVADPGVGGVFVAHPDEDGRIDAWTRPPRRGGAVAFAMHPGSFHSVTPTGVQRRTVVFHALHRGNDADVAARVRDLLTPMRFDALPGCLDAVMAEAEATRSDEATGRAAAVGWVLATWQQPDDVVVAGYRTALEDGEAWGASWPVALACWVVKLHQDVFDVHAWSVLAARTPPDAPGPVHEAWQVLVGPGRGVR